MGFAIGAAAEGFRPVAEIQFADYIFPAFDQASTEGCPGLLVLDRARSAHAFIVERAPAMCTQHFCIGLHVAQL